jgi:hypothetical protein
MHKTRAPGHRVWWRLIFVDYARPFLGATGFLEQLYTLLHSEYSYTHTHIYIYIYTATLNQSKPHKTLSKLTTMLVLHHRQEWNRRDFFLNNQLDIRPIWPVPVACAVEGVGLRPLACCYREFGSRREHGCLLCVVKKRSLRRADHSSRGTYLPSAVCQTAAGCESVHIRKVLSPSDRPDISTPGGFLVRLCAAAHMICSNTASCYCWLIMQLHI